MTNNFVEIVGYQLEKVHTSMIGWLLDSDNQLVSTDKRLHLINMLTPTSPVTLSNVENVSYTQEYSFGRSRRIDLVVRVGDSTYLVVECKTDSDVALSQLEESQRAFSEKHPDATCHYFALLLGASQFTYQHQAEKISELGYRILDLRETHRVFSSLQLNSSHVFTDWIEALEVEQARITNVESAAQGVKSLWDLKQEGYRPGFPLFYLLYGRVREHLEAQWDGCWSIGSGGNNPVLNLNSWIEKDSEDQVFWLYWEFNDSTFRLKAHFPGGKEPKAWEAWRNRILELCGTSEIQGKKTRNTKGKYVSIYKWEFDFCKQSAGQIATTALQILQELDEKLRELTSYQS